MDREVELRRVSAALVEGQRVAILGPPGVGKSRLAIEAACAVAAGAVAWVDLGEADDAATRVLVDWAHRRPDGVVVLDNAERAAAPVDRLIRRLRDHAPGVRMVVTSQVPFAEDLSVEILEPLTVPDPDADDSDIEAAPAVVLLRACLRDLAPASDLSTAQVAHLARRAGGLPLALRLTAAAARAIPAEDLLGLPPSLEGDELDRATRTVVALLSDRAARAFADLSVLGGSFDSDLGARTADLPKPRFLSAVAELVDHGLVQASTELLLPYAMLEPIRAVAARELEAGHRRTEVLDRVADACIERARALDPFMAGDRAGSLEARVAADLPRHRDVLEHLAKIGDAARALELACRLDGALYSLGWWAEKVELLDAALAIDGPPSAMRARAHAYRARPGPMHQMDLAHAERAEAMAHAAGHVRLEAYSSHVRSIALWWLGRTAESVEVARRAADALSDAHRSFESREAQKYLGVALVLDGEAEEGLAIQRAALAAVRERGENEFNVAHNLAYLGHCHRHLGDDSAAWADWTEARESCRRVGNRGTAIHVDIGLAEVAVDRGDHVRALERVGEGLELARRSRAVYYEPWAWTVAMRAHHLAGQPESALRCARRAAAALSSSPPGEAVRLAVELAGLALTAGEGIAAARLLGVAAATPDRRELPFPSPAEALRRTATERAVADLLGQEVTAHTDAGRRCTLAEAAGDLLAD